MTLSLVRPKSTRREFVDRDAADAHLAARLKPDSIPARIGYGALAGRLFDRGVWYAVTEAEAAFLREQHQLPLDPKSPLAFEVVTPEEADEINRAEEDWILTADERRVKELARTVVPRAELSPHDLYAQAVARNEAYDAEKQRARLRPKPEGGPLNERTA